MQMCPGTLVVHEDGSPALCSVHGHIGPCPAELSLEAHRVVQSCRLVYVGRCPECARHDLVCAYRPKGLAGIA
ncbi:MAG: hypothetical protein ABSG81_11225 [Acidimicrobiales bacterium]|jgi:hypothetical protein